SPGVGPVVSSSGMAYDRVHGETLLFARDGAGNTAIWHRPSVAPVWQPAATEYPAARWAAGLVYDWALARTVLHGGGPDLLADTWLFDGATWTRVTTAVAPPRAWYFGFAFDIVRARTVRFGGWDANNVDSASTWEFDGVTWTQRLPASSPPARHATAMAYDPGRQRVVLFGGSGNFTLMRNDTWEYDGSNWQQQQPATVPPSRQEHALAFDLVRGRTVLFGGARFGPNFDDTWEWDGRDWTRVLTVNAPAGRYAFAMAYDVLHQRTVLHGGSAASSQGLPITLDDTWAYDGRNWSQLVVANSPGGRMRHTMAHDLAHDTIVVFSGEERGDTWRLFPVAAACLRSGTGCAGSAGVPSLDAARGNLPILGNTFTLDLSGLPAQPGTALLAYGLGHSSWNGAPLPLSLASIGLPGCNLYLAPAALQLLAHAGAVAHALLTIPANASLAGLAVDAQGLSFDAAAPSGIGALSNAVVLAIR
ncbi:MAG TPA: hypothetical protein VK348_14575, partial [Planctomycetota bacterium]|nr:hypothetical protein [Planctomycetota bacterium]